MGGWGKLAGWSTYFFLCLPGFPCAHLILPGSDRMSLGESHISVLPSFPHVNRRVGLGPSHLGSLRTLL